MIGRTGLKSDCPVNQQSDKEDEKESSLKHVECDSFVHDYGLLQYKGGTGDAAMHRGDDDLYEIRNTLIYPTGKRHFPGCLGLQTVPACRLPGVFPD